MRKRASRTDTSDFGNDLVHDANLCQTLERFSPSPYTGEQHDYLDKDGIRGHCHDIVIGLRSFIKLGLPC